MALHQSAVHTLWFLNAVPPADVVERHWPHTLLDLCPACRKPFYQAFVLDLPAAMHAKVQPELQCHRHGHILCCRACLGNCIGLAPAFWPGTGFLHPPTRSASFKAFRAQRACHLPIVSAFARAAQVSAVLP